MALVDGTYTRYDAKGLREDLEDNIYDISPEEVPFISSISRKKCNQTLVEWQTDALAAAVTTNAQLEGDDATFVTPAATTRVGNYTQIMRKTCVVAGTLEEVDKAGRRSEMALQIAKRGAELKRDIESTVLESIGGSAGTIGAARVMATMGAWLKTNDALGTSGGSPAYTSGVPAAARTDGTQRAYTETIAKTVFAACYTSGANPKVMMVGPFNKGVVSTFSGVATRNFDLSNVSPKATAVIGAVDVYVSNFSTVRIIANRFQRERDAWFLDFDQLALRTLRPMATTPLAKTGDAEKRMLLTELTLQVKNEAGLGLAADLNAS